MTQNERIHELQVQGYGYRKIATLLDLPVNTVKSYIQRHPLHVCKQCGAPLHNTPHKKEKQFCSDKCRFAWWNAHPELRKRKAYYHFTCQNCGKEFDYYGNSAMKYCSRACYGEARRKGGEAHG